jgi:hypothetical protein
LHIANTLLRIALFVKLAIKTTDNSDMYNRAFLVGNALFFFAGSVMSLLRLPRQARVCGATKAPVGLSLLRKRELLRTRHFRQRARKNKENFGKKREGWAVPALLTRKNTRLFMIIKL